MTSKIISPPEPVKQPIAYPCLRAFDNGAVFLCFNEREGICVFKGFSNGRLGERHSDLKMSRAKPYDHTLTIQLSNAD